jgi:hypothetical protein
MPDAAHEQKMRDEYEKMVDQDELTGGDYEPYPEKSIPLDEGRRKIMQSILNLYGGSASKEDMLVYAEESVYDDPFSFCDTRYKIAGQWYGIPKVFSSSRTLKTEVVSNKPDELVFKLQQEWTPVLVHVPMTVNSLVVLTLDSNNKVRYHKDRWNKKDYSHEGWCEKTSSVGLLDFSRAGANGSKISTATTSPRSRSRQRTCRPYVVCSAGYSSLCN